MAHSSRIAEQERQLQALEDSIYKPQSAEAPAVVAEPAVVAPAAETPPAVTEAPAPEASPAPVVTDDKTWEHKYRVLQGKYNAEVPALNKSLKVLQEEVAALKAAPAPKAESLLKPEEVEKYGPEFMDMVQRAAEERFAPERNKLTETIAALTAKVDGVVTSSNQASQASFFSDLTRLAPDWEAVDAKDDWKQWLSTVDADARVTRQQLIDDALLAKDADYVARMIAKWKATQTSAPAPQKPSLESQATPVTAKGVPPVEAPKKTWTKTEVDQFYKDLMRKKFTPEDAARIEHEIDTAVAEGRYQK